MFLLRHDSANRVVHDAPETPEAYHVGTYINGVFDMTDKIKVPQLEGATFDSYELFSDYVLSIDHTKSQGVVCFDNEGPVFKVIHPTYAVLSGIRGNEPSIKFRYLQLRNDLFAVEQLKMLYPEFESAYEMYEQHLIEIAKFILYAYIKRFIKKEWTVVPQEEYRVVKQCHEWHISDRQNNLISYDKVSEILNNQPASNLNRMIKRRIHESMISDDICSGEPYTGYYPDTIFYNQ